MPPHRRGADELSDRERLAVKLLARGKTTREVSIKLNVSERTVYTWRQRPAVQRAIYQTQQELIDAGQGQGIDVVPEAVQTLVAIMNDPEARASDRIAASRALISGAHAYQERKLLERTISDLETQLYGRLLDADGDSPEDDDDFVDVTAEDGDDAPGE